LTTSGPSCRARRQIERQAFIKKSTAKPRFPLEEIIAHAYVSSRGEVPMMKTAEEIGDIWMATPKDVENWPARFSEQLGCKFEPSRKGVPRLYSKDNAIAIALMAGMVRGGAPPRVAAVMAGSFLHHIKSSSQKRLPRWIAFAAGDAKRCVPVEEPNFRDLQSHFGSVTWSFVPAGDLQTRIDQLFGAA
jgi:hypothetical protein